MALSSGRASSPSHRLFGFRFLQFSTNSRALSFAKRIGNEVASDTGGLLPLPNGFPFTFRACIDEVAIYLSRQLPKEDILVCVPYEYYRPSQLSMMVDIKKPGVAIHSHLTVMQDRLRIDQVRAFKYDNKMDHFAGYLKSRITPNTINFLFDRLYPGLRKS